MNPDDIQTRIQAIFRAEAAELLIDLEAALLELEASPTDPELIGRVFRSLHTIKGSGATSGFSDLSAFVHHVEDVFFSAREGRLTLASHHIDNALAITDVIQRYLAGTPDEAAGILESGRASLQALLISVPGMTVEGPSHKPPPIPAPGTRRFTISYLPKPELFATGNDPGAQLDDLRSLGPCTIHALTERIPAIHTLEPQACYLGWEIELETESTIDAVRDVFMFVEDECELSITEHAPGHDRAASAVCSWDIAFDVDASVARSPALVESLLLELGKIGRCRVETCPDLHEGRRGPGIWRLILDAPPRTTADTIRDAFLFLPGVDPAIEPLQPLKSAPPDLSAQTPQSTTRVEPRGQQVAPTTPSSVSRTAAAESLRVSAAKLDRLVDMVGELVILRSQVSRVCAAIKDAPPELQEASEALDRLSKELRDVVLEVRMMPIGETFNKFRRMSRDLARELGKSVDLRIDGADTELDKTVLEQLRDPLVHLVRNCLDHGLEKPADRVLANKPPAGTIRLAAEQQGDRVLITVADDGRGLDSAKIRTKAVSRGLVPADAVLSEAEAFQLVFLPGFSTADTVSQVSGRGVGLDVVKRQIEALRGTVELRSVPGRGTEIRMSVPLTVAIIEGLLVRIDQDDYILPLGVVCETIEITRQRREQCTRRNVLDMNGELVPYLRLREIFDYTTATPHLERVVIVSCGDKRLGLVVDQVLGSHQTVLKSLGWLGKRVRAFSGATVLGDGRIGLICDVPALVSYAADKRGAGGALEL